MPGRVRKDGKLDKRYSMTGSARLAVSLLVILFVFSVIIKLLSFVFSFLVGLSNWIWNQKYEILVVALLVVVSIGIFNIAKKNIQDSSSKKISKARWVNLGVIGVGMLMFFGILLSEMFSQ